MLETRYNHYIETKLQRGDEMVFEDWRIDEVLSGSELTNDEREYLVNDTPRFEECDKTQDELISMSDSNLMATCYRVWSEYCK